MYLSILSSFSTLFLLILHLLVLSFINCTPSLAYYYFIPSNYSECSTSIYLSIYLSMYLSLAAFFLSIYRRLLISIKYISILFLHSLSLSLSLFLSLSLSLNFNFYIRFPYFPLKLSPSISSCLFLYSPLTSQEYLSSFPFKFIRFNDPRLSLCLSLCICFSVSTFVFHILLWKSTIILSARFYWSFIWWSVPILKLL